MFSQEIETVQTVSNSGVGGDDDADLEKVVKCPQAENSEFQNVLKIAEFATKNDQK